MAIFRYFKVSGLGFNQINNNKSYNLMSKCNEDNEVLSQPQPQHNLTQPQHSGWVGHENDFATPTPPPQKLNSSLCEPQNNIH